MKNKKKIILPIIFAVLLVAALVVYMVYGPNGIAGKKTITVQIVTDEKTVELTIKTEEEFLRGALEQEKLIAGTESSAGLYVLTVNGVTADESAQQWWCFTKGGETLMTGVDSTPIEDGDAFEITLTAGW